MTLRYQCLLIDHDDTAVNSTAAIHYPAHLEVMETLRPHHPRLSLDGWFRKNFHPGIGEFIKHELRLSEQEQQVEFGIWRKYTTTRSPDFFPGFLELLAEYRSLGGRVAVISHSEKEIIESHYRNAQEGAGFMPDLIFGWDNNPERRKPHPWPALEALRHFGLGPREALIVDDLKPGVLMAQAAGIPIVGAGWSHRIPEIEEFMRANCLRYCISVQELRDLVLNP